MKVQPWLNAAVQNIAQHALSPLFIASVNATKLDDVAEECVHAAPDDLARLGFAVAHALDASSPAVANLDPEAAALAQRIADALLEAKRPLIIAGTSLGSQALLEASANIAKALKLREKNASISLVAAEANSLGLAMLGGDAVEVGLQSLIDGQADAVLVLENDLYRRVDAAQGGRCLARRQGLAGARSSAHRDRSAGRPAVPGRQLRRRRWHPGQPGRSRPALLPGLRAGLLPAANPHPRRLALVACTALHPAAQAGGLDPAGSGYRCLRRQQRRTGRHHGCRPERLVPHQGHEAGPRTRCATAAVPPCVRANLSVHEPRTPQDQDSALAFSMEGYSGSAEPRQQVPFAWSPGWNSPQAWNKFQDEVGGHLRAGDPGMRLIEPKGDGLSWFTGVPKPFAPAAGQWLVVPLYHLFGSDETSALAAPIQERMGAAYVALAKAEAERLGVNDGALLSLQVAGANCACRCASMTA